MKSLHFDHMLIVCFDLWWCYEAKLHKLCHCQKTYELNWMCTSLKNVNDG